MNQISMTAQKRARTKRRKEIESEIKRVEYLLANYKFDSEELKLVEKNLNQLKQMYEVYASDDEIKGAN